jgi:hypothetical protein
MPASDISSSQRRFRNLTFKVRTITFKTRDTGGAQYFAGGVAGVEPGGIGGVSPMGALPGLGPGGTTARPRRTAPPAPTGRGPSPGWPSGFGDYGA